MSTSQASQQVVVVGGSSGIGEAAARRFLADGYQVTIIGRDRARLAGALERLPGARGHALDAGDAAAMRAFFSSHGAEHGRVDHLVLCLSGARGAGPIAELRLEELRGGFEEKLFPTLTALQAALPHLGSSVTLVSAVSARAAMLGTAGLAAINAAVEALVRPLAAELSPLRVNVVSPGVIDTPWWSSIPEEVKRGFFARAAATLPVGRVGTAEEAAAAIYAVATNGFITGSVLEVDGGAHLAR